MSDNKNHPAGGNRAQRRSQKTYKRYRELKLSIPRHEKMLARRTGELVDHINQLLDFAVDETFECYSNDQGINFKKIETEFSKPENTDLIKAILATAMFTAKTPEGTVYEMVKVVEARVQARQFLRMLLAAVDNTALHIIKTTPAWAKDLRGNTLSETIFDKLTDVAFIKRMAGREESLTSALNMAAKLRWRGADEKTIHAVFLKAAANRAADIKDGGVDDMFDENLVMLDPKDRVEQTARFKKRLDMEYERLVLDDSSPAASAATPELGTVLRDAISTAKADATASNKPISLKPRAPYDDKSFMRVGAAFWEHTYKCGLTDEETATKIAAENKDTGFQDDSVQFAALWAVHAFQRITTSHTFAAALMCSDADRSALESIQKQWRAFMVVVPDGMLVIRGKNSGDPYFDFGRILLATYEGRSRMILLATNIRTQDGSTVFVSTYDEAPTFTDLLMLEPDAELEKDDQSRRLMVMAKRLVAGLLLSLQHEPNFVSRNVEARPPSKKHRDGEPAHRIVNVGRPLTVDCRDAVRRYIEEGKGKRKSGHGAYSPPTVQVLVRGHWRQQPHGPRSSLRKRMWITPFWRGPEDAIIRTRPLKPEGTT